MKSILNVYCLMLILFVSNLKFSIAIAQEFYVMRIEYAMQLDVDGKKYYEAKLYPGAFSAFFTYQQKLVETNTGLLRTDSISNSYSFELVDTSRYYLISNRTAGLWRRSEQIPGENQEVEVEEVYQPIKWNYTGEEKLINGFHCYSANATIGGRNYTVWYTDSIPISFGPWKLHDLPGIVLEAYDDTNEVFMQLTRIIPINAITLEKLSPLKPSVQKLSHEQYVNKWFAYLETMQKRMQSRFGRNFKVKLNSSAIKGIDRYDP
jgi:GLPGLI family protein